MPWRDGKHNFERFHLEGPMPKLKRGEGEERATDFVESLDRGIRLLEMFGTIGGPMTLSDLARAADLPRATARRILFTLEHGGFVTTDGKLFTLTPRVLTLAASYLHSSQVVTVLQPVLDRIATAAQEISSLAVLDGDEVVFIARGSPTRVFSAGLDIGYRLPAFCTSVGRVMLGQFDDGDLATRLDAMQREPMTPYTVTDPKRLLLPCAAIASRAIRWSIARPSRIFDRSPCRSAATTASSSPPSTWARMSTVFRRTR